jgi:hypothetical protein
VVRGASSLLRSPAVSPAAAALFLAYSHVATALPGVRDAIAAAIVALIGMPLVAVAVLAQQTLHRIRWEVLLAIAVGCVLVAYATTQANHPAEASTAKIVAAGIAGLLAAAAVTSPAEAAVVAVVIIGVDAYSVFAGPTKDIIENHPNVLSAFTIRVPAPGTHFAELGLTDLFFLALLATVAREFALRPVLTWTLMGASFGASYALAYAFNRALPALPLLALGFLAPNARTLLNRRRRA